METNTEATKLAKDLIKQSLVGKDRYNFLSISSKNRTFLFKMRGYYEKHIADGAPFYCSPGQLKLLYDLISQAGDTSDKVEVRAALEAAVERLKKKLSPMISAEAKKIAIALYGDGMNEKKIRDVLVEKIYG